MEIRRSTSGLSTSDQKKLGGESNGDGAHRSFAGASPESPGEVARDGEKASGDPRAPANSMVATVFPSEVPNSGSGDLQLRPDLNEGQGPCSGGPRKKRRRPLGPGERGDYGRVES